MTAIPLVCHTVIQTLNQLGLALYWDNYFQETNTNRVYPTGPLYSLVTAERFSC